MDCGLMAGVQFPIGQYFYLLHSVQTGSGAYPASYHTQTYGFSLGIKRPELKVVQSLPFNAEVKNGGVISPSPNK
jgi:hypothetical protein